MFAPGAAAAREQEASQEVVAETNQAVHYPASVHSASNHPANKRPIYESKASQFWSPGRASLLGRATAEHLVRQGAAKVITLDPPSFTWIRRRQRARRRSQGGNRGHNPACGQRLGVEGHPRVHEASTTRVDSGCRTSLRTLRSPLSRNGFLNGETIRLDGALRMPLRKKHFRQLISHS